MPYWRLSGFYFFYFAAIGALVPYFTLYLKSLGFSAPQIGELMALLLLMRIVAPNIWGWIADMRGRRMGVVRLAAFFAAVAFAGILLGTSFAWIAAVMLVFAFFRDACLPQLEAATLSHLAGQSGQYARIRLWGSVGFIVVAVGLGLVLQQLGTWWLLPSTLALLTGVWAFTLVIPESPPRSPEPAVGLPRVIARPEVAGLLAACFLMQASHGPYYTFYSIYLERFAYSKSMIGMLWAFGVVCEIGVFLIMHRVQARTRSRQILLASFVVATARWLLIGYFPQQLAILLVAQALHGITFGAFHAAAIELVHRFFTGRHQVRGQAIYGSMGFGLGGALGSFYSGLSWMRIGAADTFAIAAGLALAAFCVAWFAIRRDP
jgi:PPP family 3-phenylpropionic acid transporter